MLGLGGVSTAPVSGVQDGLTDYAKVRLTLTVSASATVIHPVTGSAAATLSPTVSATANVNNPVTGSSAVTLVPVSAASVNVNNPVTGSAAVTLTLTAAVVARAWSTQGLYPILIKPSTGEYPSNNTALKPRTGEYFSVSTTLKPYTSEYPAIFAVLIPRTTEWLGADPEGWDSSVVPDTAFIDFFIRYIDYPAGVPPTNLYGNLWIDFYEREIGPVTGLYQFAMSSPTWTALKVKYLQGCGSGINSMAFGRQFGFDELAMKVRMRHRVAITGEAHTTFGTAAVRNTAQDIYPRGFNTSFYGAGDIHHVV